MKHLVNVSVVMYGEGIMFVYCERLFSKDSEKDPRSVHQARWLRYQKIVL